MNIQQPPPAPINALATALSTLMSILVLHATSMDFFHSLIRGAGAAESAASIAHIVCGGRGKSAARGTRGCLFTRTAPQNKRAIDINLH